MTLTNFTLPITIGNTTGESVTGYDIRFTFDPAVVGLQATPVDATGTLSSGMSIATNTTTPGLLTIIAAQAAPLTGSGTLLKVNFTRLGAQGTSTILTWTKTELDDSVNDCIHPATPNNGTIFIGGGPSAVKLDRCIATGYDNGVYLEWKTGLEVDNLGFNVYREKAGQKELITPEIVAGSALLTGKANLKTGRTYAWWDNSKDQQGVQYWLEDIDLNGQSNWHGPVAAQFVGGSPPSQSDAAVLSGIGNSKASPDAGNNVERRALARPIADQPAIQFDLAGGPAAKVSVRHEGWYTLSSSQLVAGGLKQNPNPDRLQMYVDGVQVPINVITDDKKQLSAVEFYGVGLDAAYTDARVYWIVEGKENGLRIQQVNADAHPSSDRSFNYSVERRDRTVYFSSLRNGERENFFGPVVGRDAATQSLSLQRIDTAATIQAQVEVSLQGVTAIPHRVWVYANGTFVGEIPFNGQELRVASFALPISLLREGDNEVRLAAQGGPLDVSLIDYIRLSYRHTFSAVADQLRFTATSGAAVTVDGFTSAAIRVFDVTNQDQVQQLVGKVEQQKTGYAVTVTPAEKGDRTLLAIAGQVAVTPPGVSANVSSNLRSNSHAANLLIVTNRDFFTALEPLKQLRTSQGYKVEIIDVEDVYDEFSFGDKSPYAVRAFLQYARTNWKTPPQYVLLAADASYDPKNYLGFGDWDIVPTKLVDTESMETSSDDWFADFDADGVPEMAVGRLPVRSRAEAASMVARIVSYDKSSGSAELTLVADANEGFDFESANAQLRALVPSDTRIVEIDRGQMGDQAKPALIDAINRGQKIVNYTGHGNVDQWRANLLTNADAGLLTNQNHLALFVMMTCLNGYSDDPALSSLAKALMKSASGGAVAVWASSGMTMPDQQALMNQEFYRQVFGRHGISLGDAIKSAKAAVSDSDVRRSWMLLGDPTMRLK
ncbi:MAG TPA: C25 family cysteine peptidase [Blastocatellia bacterium]|nr:C25 family cysteine peptidase [Blastocatellia bacterium]